MWEVGAREKDIENKMFWRHIMCCGYPLLKGKAEKRTLSMIFMHHSSSHLPFLCRWALLH